MARHPATAREDLPHEVQACIKSIEMDLYDQKQDSGALKALIASGAGALFEFASVVDAVACAVRALLLRLPV